MAKIHTQINPGITIVKDKVVLVTGGSKGIGLGIASAFTHAGAQVFVCGRNSPAPGALPPAVELITAEVRDPEDAQD